MLEKIRRLFHKKSFGNPVVNPHLERFEINSWVLSEFILDRLVPVVGIHPYPLQDMMLMCGAVCRLQPDLIIEWGTNLGKSARIFHETVKAFGLSAQVHTVDLPPDVDHVEHPKNRLGEFVRDIPEVKIHLGDGLAIGLDIVKQNPTLKKYLFFLDGDHSLESVSRELHGITQAHPQTWVLLHDTFFQSAESGYNIGPFTAVENFLRDRPNYQRISTIFGLPGMTLLIPKPTS